MGGRHELTDRQWELIRDQLPGRAGAPGPNARDNRLFVNAVLYVLKTGVPWRDLPERFGNWNSVWRRYDRWCASGVWQKIMALITDPAAEAAELLLDSTTVKAHPCASGSRRLPGEKKRPPMTDGVWGVRAAA